MINSITTYLVTPLTGSIHTIHGNHQILRFTVNRNRKIYQTWDSYLLLRYFYPFVILLVKVSFCLLGIPCEISVLVLYSFQESFNLRKENLAFWDSVGRKPLRKVVGPAFSTFFYLATYCETFNSQAGLGACI